VQGLFITFEGIEGSGKTTQLLRARDLLASRGRRVLITREPGGTETGDRVRRILLGSAGQIDPAAELLLFFAARRQNLAQVIEPTLAKGTIVLCDRYADASRAYQGAGRGLGEKLVDDLHLRLKLRDPDRTYLLDCPVETALGRLEARGHGRDRIEREKLAFHRRVRTAYLSRARREPRRFFVLDAALSPDEVFDALKEDLLTLVAHPRKAR